MGADRAAEFRRTATDAMIIAISCANILNISLSESSIKQLSNELTHGAFSKQMTIAAGRMASACERLDHLEDFPFRSVLCDEALAILSSCLALFRAEGWEPIQEMKDRLAPIKAKSIFHGNL